jgi:hypothetical protein
MTREGSNNPPATSDAQIISALPPRRDFSDFMIHRPAIV